MAFEIKKLPAGGGVFFKPANYADVVAILVEVKRFEAQRPTNFGPKDTVYADLTVFKDAAALDGGTPEILPNAAIEASCLVRDLETLVGQATIAKLGKVESKKAGYQAANVWREVDSPVQAKVIAYANARDEAIAAAVADAPSFE